MQVQRVGSPNAAIAAEVILLDTRAKLYGLLAGDAGRARYVPTDDADETRRSTRPTVASSLAVRVTPRSGPQARWSSPRASDQ